MSPQSASRYYPPQGSIEHVIDHQIPSANSGESGATLDDPGSTGSPHQQLQDIDTVSNSSFIFLATQDSVREKRAGCGISVGLDRTHGGGWLSSTYDAPASVL
jgi:hypothetical protein